MTHFQLLPAIDLMNGECVRLMQGDYSLKTIYDKDPVKMAKKWEKEGGNILHLVDLDGAKVGEPRNLDTISRICSAVSLPCEFGGGIRSMTMIQTVLDAGVTRVILGTSALKDPEFVKTALERYSDQIVLGIDARDGFVAVEGWLETSTITAEALAKMFIPYGLKRVIYTDIRRDGMMQGPNVAAIQALAQALPIPVIASGGVSSNQDVIQLSQLFQLGIEGCIIGKALYTGDVQLEQLAGSNLG